MNALGSDPVTTVALLFAFGMGAIPARFLRDSWRRRSEGATAWLFLFYETVAIIASATAGVLAIRNILR